MVRSSALVVALATAVGAASPSAANSFESPLGLLKSKAAKKLTPETVTSKIVISGDDLDGEIQFSSEKVLREVSGFEGILDPADDDSYLRAFIDKKTGVRVIQIYSFHQRADGSHRFRQANFESESGLQSAGIRDIDVSVDGCRLWCVVEDTVGFEVDEKTLRWAAAKYAPGTGGYWRFRLKSQAGDDVDDGLPYAEIAGFLDVMDRHVAIKK